MAQSEQNKRDYVHPRVCPECDLVHEHVPVEHGHAAYCKRCGKLLYRGHAHALERSLAFAIAGIAFFTVANLAPLLVFTMQGNSNANLLIDGGIAFMQTDFWALGILVLFASVIAPIAILCLLVMMITPIILGSAPRFIGRAFRLYVLLRPWAMGEIFVIGLIVAYVKLADFAEVGIGLSMIGFIGMVITTILALMYLDPRELWLRIEELRK
ncbi:hypothetical protein GUA87_10290 [Sneathiella sp. P13V-1]|uniref:paraquat-inducible protein A n=1 Tax=Sneathiella sp. P13V-1 TaxID=2697366 RepID=UPI00187B8868|nr:paraquat-inducible protein A [Sneathiella sp. P13V-1]MBE7637233.1 hypothetical protein [Sneathiella sp. P13V-1]